MTKYFKNRFGRKIKTTPQEPRLMDAINTEYSELIGKVGQAQYQAYIYTQKVAELNRELERVNQEAAERKRLDAEAQTKTEEVKNA
jgi:hypothetical protein